MFGFLKKKKKNLEEREDERLRTFSSNLGRSITSIITAKKELYHPPKSYTPEKFICKKGHEFFGVTFDTNKKNISLCIFQKKQLIINFL